jgi:aminoglycoside/choline kinase family phosphotransferase
VDDIAERPGIPADVTEITAEWLDEALSGLPALEGATVAGVTEIGTGFGLAGSAARIELRSTGSHPSAAVLKLARRQSGAAELAFYRDVAPQMPCRVPHCYGGWIDADPDADRAVLVLEALPVRRQGDVLTGATVDQAHAVLDAAAAFHAAFVHDAPPSLPLFGYDIEALRQRLTERTAPFLLRYSETLPVAVRARIDVLPSRLDTLSAVLASAPATLIHTDFHLDNVLFLEDGEPAVLDWPGARRGAAAIDVGRFLVEGVADALLPEHTALVARYRSSRAQAGAPVDPEFDDQLDATLDLQLVHMIIWAGAPEPSNNHPRMPKLVEAFCRRNARLGAYRAGAR